MIFVVLVVFQLMQYNKVTRHGMYVMWRSC